MNEIDFKNRIKILDNLTKSNFDIILDKSSLIKKYKNIEEEKIDYYEDIYEPFTKNKGKNLHKTVSDGILSCFEENMAAESVVENDSYKYYSKFILKGNKLIIENMKGLFFVNFGEDFSVTCKSKTSRYFTETVYLNINDQKIPLWSNRTVNDHDTLFKEARNATEYYRQKIKELFIESIKKEEYTIQSG